MAALVASIVILVIIALIEGFVSFCSFNKGGKLGTWLGVVTALSAAMSILYLISISTTDYQVSSVFSSLYFISVDLTLLSLLVFAMYYTKMDKNNVFRIILMSYGALALIDIGFMAANPISGFSIGFTEHILDGRTYYSYDMHLPFYGHLAYCYALSLGTIVLFGYRIAKLPREYGIQYLICVIALVVVQLANAAFLFVPANETFGYFDSSFPGHAIACCIFYFATFAFPQNGIASILRSNIFANIDQAIVLFDYDQNLILKNERADQYLGDLAFDSGIKMNKFISECRISLDLTSAESFSTQCFMGEGDSLKPYRCDYRRLLNNQGKLLGHLFVFANASLDTDILTGFQNWESFRIFLSDNPSLFREEMLALACDINSLGLINSAYGKAVGDQSITSLANSMKNCLPATSYFIRGSEANLIAIIKNAEKDDIVAILESLRNDLGLDFQYAIASIDNGEVLDGISSAVSAMRINKLLDKNASRSSILSSLLKAMQSFDPHVEQSLANIIELGMSLGRRIKLSDIQLSDLKLALTLHDVGEIGIPLDIMNKPAKLNEEELALVRSHVEKGYAILNSSKELSKVAELIRYHHESWDGSGYPDGLSYESIPLISRIVHLVDSYDAMVNDRVYRKALTREAAIEEVKNGAGKSFDPYLASEFLDMLEENPLLGKGKNGGIALKIKELSDSGSRQSDENVHPITYSKYIIDETFRIIETDEAFTLITGFSHDDIEKRDLHQADLLPEEDRLEYNYKVGKKLSESDFVFLEHRLEKKDGSIIHVNCFGRRYFDPLSKSERSEIIISDSSSFHFSKILATLEDNKSKMRLAKWRNTYRVDPLTGLLNHSAIAADTEQSLLEKKGRAMMFMLDLDHFKEFNDKYGHPEGDNLLISVAHSLEKCLRKDDLCARMGGDEFIGVLFLQESDDPQKAKKRAKQIFDFVNRELATIEKDYVGFSMGVVLQDEKLDTFNKLYKAADDAMYDSKNNGRGILSFYALDE